VVLGRGGCGAAGRGSGLSEARPRVGNGLLDGAEAGAAREGSEQGGRGR
jgi:hypothetical protein